MDKLVDIIGWEYWGIKNKDWWFMGDQHRFFFWKLPLRMDYLSTVGSWHLYGKVTVVLQFREFRETITFYTCVLNYA